jgi:hypothetical protein
MSALTGDAPSVTSVPSRKHIATVVGTLAAILPSVFWSDNVAEFRDEFNPAFDDRLGTRDRGAVERDLLLSVIEGLPFVSGILTEATRFENPTRPSYGIILSPSLPAVILRRNRRILALRADSAKNLRAPILRELEDPSLRSELALSQSKG